MFRPKGMAFVVPVGLLEKRMYSGRNGRRISWANWEKDVTTITLPDAASIQLVDMKVLALHDWDGFEKDWSVEVYDLSKSSRRDTQIQQIGEEGDGRCKKAMQAQRWFDRFQKHHLTTSTAGNKIVCSYVSPPVCIQHRPCHAHIIVLYRNPRSLLVEVII